ncbi:hypothetical protein WM652_003771 [Salmonella enterica]|nr:hypothetical protein [Salmonella enterica]
MTEDAQRSAYAPDLIMSVIRQSPDNFRVLRLRAPECISAFRSVGGGWLFFTGVFCTGSPISREFVYFVVCFTPKMSNKIHKERL